MDTPLSEIGTAAVQALASLYPALARHTLLIFVGLVLAAAGISLLIRALFLKKAGWLSRKEAPKKTHYTFIALTAVFLLLQAFHGLSGLSLYLFFASFCASAAAVYGLITWRGFGPAAAILSFWLTLPLKELSVLAADIRDYNALASFTIPGKIGVYAVTVYSCGRFLALAFIAAVLTAAVTAYYTKRRYLFRSARDQYFRNIAVCPGCGAPILKEGAFCTSCGADLMGRGFSELKWEALETDRYCPNCGNKTDKDGRCPACEGLEPLGKTVKKAVKEAAGNELKKYGAIAAVAVICLLPLFINDPLKYLTKGSAAVTNEYIGRLNAWHEDPSLSGDAAWLDSFDEASDALYAYNGRGFTVVPERLNYANAYIYIQYLDASYDQMAVMERISEAVHAGDPEAFAGLGSYFNETMNMQQRALASGLSMITLNGNILLSFENMVLDSLRFYFSFIPAVVKIILLFVTGIGTLAAGIVLMLRAPEPSPFIRIRFRTDNPEEIAALNAKMKADKRLERIITAIVAGVLLAAVGISSWIEASPQKSRELTFESAIDEGFTRTGTALLNWLSLCRTDPEDALAAREQVIREIDRAEEALVFLSDSFTTVREDEETEDWQVRREARQTAEDLHIQLDAVRTGLEKDMLPEQESVSEILALFIRGMQLDQNNKIQAAFDKVEELFD